MSRIQTIVGYTPKVIAAAATPETLTVTQKFVKSIIIQAAATNTDFMYVGDASFQNFALSPGKSLEIHGDNLDHGTGGILDISTIYIRAAVNGESVVYATLDNT